MVTLLCSVVLVFLPRAFGAGDSCAADVETPVVVTGGRNKNFERTGPWHSGSWSDGLVENTCPQSRITTNLEGKLTVGGMSSVEISGQLEVDDNAVIRIGEFTKVNLTRFCKWTMNKESFVEKTFGVPADRSEIYCNNTMTMQKNSIVRMQPQVFINISAPLFLGQGSTVSLADSTVLEVGADLTIGGDKEEQVLMDLAARSRLLVNGTSGSVTFSSGGPGKITSVTLGESARFLIEGDCHVGGTLGTHLIFESSAYLYVGPNGGFTIKAAVLVIGESSYWLLEGTLTINSNTGLRSHLQSQLIIPEGAQLINNGKGDIVMGERATVYVGGLSSLEGPFTIGSGANASVFGKLVTNAALTVGVSGKLFIADGVSIFVEAPIVIEEHATLSLDPTIPKGQAGHYSKCFVFMAVTVKAYQRLIISSTSVVKNDYAWHCMP